MWLTASPIMGCATSVISGSCTAEPHSGSAETTEAHQRRPRKPPTLVSRLWRGRSRHGKAHSGPACDQETSGQAVDGDGEQSADGQGDQWTSRALALASAAMPFVPARVSAAFASGKLEGSRSSADPITGPPKSSSPRVVTAALLIVDVSGFTALSEDAKRRLGSEGVETFSLALSTFFSIMIDLVNDYDGDVDCFAGDAVLIVFEPIDGLELTDGGGPGPAADVPGSAGGTITPAAEGEEPGPEASVCLRGAVNRAVACAQAIHAHLDGFRNEVEDPPLRMHSALAAGEQTCSRSYSSCTST